MKKVAYIIILLLITSCSSGTGVGQYNIISSISPIDGLVKEITVGDFACSVLVPEGTSPESYAPTPMQIKQIENADIIFITGTLDFEREITERFSGNKNVMSKIVDLSAGIQTISSENGNSVDPHIWMSINNLNKIAYGIYNKINTVFPDSVKYDNAYAAFVQKINVCDSIIKENISNAELKCFVIYHPALTYFSAEYGLKQVAIENEGKEPSAKHISDVADYVRVNKINYMLYQKEMTDDIIQPIVQAINVKPVMINPLSDDIIHELVRVSEIIGSN